MGIPIFIEPVRPALSGLVEGLTVAKGTLGFVVKNTGNLHFLAQTIQIKALDAARLATVFEKKLDGWYVLAGGTRLWEVEIPKEACAKSKVLHG